jgi:hypothetical protein
MGACAGRHVPAARAQPRESAVSGAILYVAIVAIWALVLVPRWLHQRHSTARAADAPGPDGAGYDADDTGSPGCRPLAADGEAASPGKDGELMSPTATVGDVSMDSDVPAEDRDVPRAAGPAVPEQRPERVPLPAGTVPSSGRHVVSPPEILAAHRQATIVRSRRRLLMTLIALTVGAVGLAASRYAAPWIILPPAGMLTVLLVLLRQAARSDAQRELRYAETALPGSHLVAGVHPGAYVPAQRAGEPAAGPVPFPVSTPVTAPGASEPTAEVIDISGRVTDQVYDQYADVPDRAVGD